MFASPSLTAKLSPITKLVLKVLEQNKWMSQKQIIAKTFLSPGTAKYAIKSLKEKGKICPNNNFNSLETIHKSAREKDVR